MRKALVGVRPRNRVRHAWLEVHEKRLSTPPEKDCLLQPLRCSVSGPSLQQMVQTTSTPTGGASKSAKSVLTEPVWSPATYPSRAATSTNDGEVSDLSLPLTPPPAGNSGLHEQDRAIARAVTAKEHTVRC